MQPASKSPRIAGLVLLAATLSCAGPGTAPEAPPEPADLVLLGGRIVTVDDRHGTVEALAARDGRIVAVGSNAQISPFAGKDTRVIDLRGRTAIPGFIEGHAHFTGIGQAKQRLNLMNVQSWDQVVAMVKEAVAKAKPGEWILGRGWHQEKWNKVPARTVQGFPTHDSLSAISPDNPVALTHASGHASFFNAKAMQLAGIDEKTQDPPGGEILKDAAGNPIGVFSETAQGLVRRVQMRQRVQRRPEQIKADLRRTIQLADRECVEHGVTSFQDAGSSFGTVDALKEMAEAGELKTRLYVMIRESNARLARRLPTYRMIGVGDDRLTVRALKRTIDGALGSRGAWLLEPYSDSPNSTGLATASVADVTKTAELAVEHGYQLCVHAIGDRANREVLNIFEQMFRKHDLDDPRWRVEHAQHLHPADIPRFAELGVIASMQGIHCTSDAPWVIPRLGADRAAAGAYVWRKLIDSGALVTNGTDAPVEDIDPIASFYASVSRRMKDGAVFFPEQRMTRMEALRSYTIDCAKAAFEEDLKGSLTPGKLADIVVLSRDILTVPEKEIPGTVVHFTIIGGKVEYEAAWTMEGVRK